MYGPKSKEAANKAKARTARDLVLAIHDKSLTVETHSGTTSVCFT